MNAVMRGTKEISLKGSSYEINVMPNLKLLLLLISFLGSSFAFLYLKEFNRQMYATYHNLQQEEYILKMLNNSLLGKYSTLNAQITVQDQAHKLEMQHPKDVVSVEM